MDSDASDNYEHLYENGDASKHEKLVQKVLSLNKTQHLKKPSRTEPTLQVSEFNLVKSITGEKGSVQISELTQSLKNRKSREKISENVKRVQKASHTLPKPLEKPQANKIRRSVAYEKTRLQLDRWEATVSANRVSTNLSFPLDNDVKMDKKESENFAKMWRVKSKLAEELEKHEPTVEFHINLEQEEFPLTMKEMLARRKESAKLRAYQGYKEAKARRQNKIKSKKYHRIQKREKIKKKLKEFELLQKTNPEEALKKLEEIEKSRVEERFSLRHKSTGKWARSKQIRAKYDQESRQVLAQQLTLSRDLTQKLNNNESESEEDEAEADKTQMVVDENNPWVNGVKPGKEVNDFISGYRKYWMETNQKEMDEAEKGEEKTQKGLEIGTLNEGLNVSSQSAEVNEEEIDQEVKKVEKKKKQRSRNQDSNINSKIVVDHKDRIQQGVKKKKQSKKNTVEDSSGSKSTSEWEVSLVENETVIEDMFNKLENKLQKKMLRNAKRLQNQLNKKGPKMPPQKGKKSKRGDLTLPLQKKTPQIDEELIQNSGKEPENVEKHQDLATLKTILASETRQTESDIDPNKYLKVKPTNLSTAIPDILSTEENEEEVDQRAMISEAFEDDDILDDFDKDKKDEVDRNKPKNIDLNLPGWGSWGGANIKVNKRKKRRFTIKAPEKIPRRDDNKGFLILNEGAQSKIKEHMVSEVPFPFKTVKDFEASMRAPISNTFVPETAYRRLIQPAVTTKMGTIIEPMSRDLLLNKSG